jgi:hypothetical protein
MALTGWEAHSTQDGSGKPIYILDGSGVSSKIYHQPDSKICFNFLWNGNNTTCHFHLCSWEVLSRPKSCGGWGLRNLEHFNLALLANTLWNTLFGRGLWHNIVMDKYLRHSDVIQWFRSTIFEASSASRIWRNLLKSIHLLLHWQVWLPGSGNQVRIGRDMILGMGEKALLSQALLDHLSRKEIKVLVNAWNPQCQMIFLILGSTTILWA